MQSVAILLTLPRLAGWLAVVGLNLDTIMDFQKRSSHAGVGHQDATILSTPSNISNPITFFVPPNATVSITAIASSSLFQNITFSGVPNAAPFSFVGTGEGTLMVSGFTQVPFVTPFTQSSTYILEMLFQYSQSEGSELLDGVIGIDPIQIIGATGDTALLAIQSQDASVNDTNSSLALITLSNLGLP